jgi:hypothetical protein
MIAALLNQTGGTGKTTLTKRAITTRPGDAERTPGDTA